MSWLQRCCYCRIVEKVISWWTYKFRLVFETNENEPIFMVWRPEMVSSCRKQGMDVLCLLLKALLEHYSATRDSFEVFHVCNGNLLVGLTYQLCK